MSFRKNNHSNIDIKKAEANGIRFYSSKDEQEMFYLKNGLSRTAKEKFLFLMELIKIQQSIKKSKV